jgi:hypothetical protein
MFSELGAGQELNKLAKVRFAKDANGLPSSNQSSALQCLLLFRDPRGALIRTFSMMTILSPFRSAQRPE